MKTSKNRAFIIILALLISSLFIIPADIFAATGPVSVSISSNFSNINKDEKIALSWNSTNADGCVAHSNTQSPWYGIRSISGNESITPSQSATYFITCSNTSGYSGMAQVAVAVGGFQTSTVGVNLTANPESIFRGESTTLIWSSTNAVSCEASGYWSGLKPSSGSERISPSTTVNYTLRCNNNLGQSASDTQVIFVNPNAGTPVIPTVSGIFNIACAVSQSTVSIGQRISFGAAQSYGTEPVKYSWSGDVSGNTQTLNASFPSDGIKTARITATDSNGRTASNICSVQVVQSGTPIKSITLIVKSSKISAPTNLKPNGDEFPSDTEEVTLSWDSVKGAKLYAVRMEPKNKTDERNERNNCSDNPHYLCVNNLDLTSIKVSVKSGDTYSWWVHAVAYNGVFSDPASAKFSIKIKEAGAKGNFLANIFGSVSGWRILFLLLLIIAFILGYIFGKRKSKSEARPIAHFSLPSVPPSFKP